MPRALHTIKHNSWTNFISQLAEEEEEEEEEEDETAAAGGGGGVMVVHATIVT